jgi:hypothetical protein
VVEYECTRPWVPSLTPQNKIIIIIKAFLKGRFREKKSPGT